MNTLRDYETKIFNKINPAVRFSVSRYVLAIGFFVAIVVFGLISTFNLGVDQLPSINVPVVVVSTQFSGAAPSVVDQQVTQVVESAVSTISGISEISSFSQTGSSTVIIDFDPSTDKYSDTNQVSSAVSAAVGSLPVGITTPVVKTLDPNSSPIIQVGVKASGASLADVADYVTYNLIPILQRVNGVADISTDGGPTKEFQVLLNPNKLAFYNVTPGTVASAIGSSSLNTSIGSITHKNNALSFSTRDQPNSAGSIKGILVDTSRGIKVEDVASVRETPAIDSYARINGTPVVLVNIRKTTDANSVAVAAAVRQAIERTQMPAGYSATIGNDTTGPITASVQNTYREILIVSLVVAIIVLLFLGKLNTAIAVILAIPIALSASPILYRLCGFTFNLVSLLALINAIGIVVDDSIVVAENVERYRAMGMSLKESVLKGASEVFSAVVAASLSLLSVLIPVSFMPGFIGGYIRQFALGLAAAVAFSLLEALLFLTVRMAYTRDARPFTWKDLAESFGMLGPSFRWGFAALRKPAGIVVGLAALGFLASRRLYVWMPAMILYPVALGVLYYGGRILLTFLQSLTTTLHEGTEAAIGWIRDAYVRSLAGVLRRSVWVLVGAGVFLVATLAFLGSHVSFNFVPQSDNGVMTISLRLPPGTPMDITNEATGRVERYLFKRRDVTKVQAVVADRSMFAGSRESQRANLTVELTPVTTRKGIFELIPEVKNDVTALLPDFPSARIFVSAAGGFGGSSSLTVNVSSSDFDLLQKNDTRIIKAIQGNPWVLDVTSGLADATLENVFVPAPSRLDGTGLSPTDVARALQIAASGTTAASVQRGGKSYDVNVMVDPIYLTDEQSLLNLPLYSPSVGSSLHVGQLGSFTLNQAPTSMSRDNRIYYVQYTINLKPGAPPFLVVQDQLSRDLRSGGTLTGDLSLGAGGGFGPAALARQLQTQAPYTFLLALFLAYLVMGAQFNSWRYPIYLLLPVPIALVGALWMVVIKGGGLDIFGLMGMLMLIGLSAKNAILYLDFVVERMGKMPFKDALIEAGRLRFRPIVMTTLTVLVTSFPLIFGRGEGSEFGQGLGVVTFGGIILSAVLTFFVVPAAFFLFERRRAEVTQGQSVAETGVRTADLPG